MENNGRNPIDQKTFFREWLEKLQQESWQLELLISGFAIFGIYAFRTVIKDIEIFAEYETAGNLSVVSHLIIFLLKKGWIIFFVNLIIHVLLRGLWIGAIGLRYVSGDINFDGFKFDKKFTNFLKDKIGSYDDYIEELEKMCSVIFAYTFLLFLLFSSLMFFTIQFVFIIGVGQELFTTESGNFAFITSVAFIYLLGGLVVFTDFITLGAFKKIKEPNFSKIYYYIYRFYSYTTLSFLYRPLVYNFIDNKYTKKLFFLSIPYIGLIVFGSKLFVNHPFPNIPSKAAMEEIGMYINDNYYDDLRNTKLAEFPNEERKMSKSDFSFISMEQFEIDKSISSFFIPIDRNFSKLVSTQGNAIPFFNEGLSFNFMNSQKSKIPKLETEKTIYSKARAKLIEERTLINKQLKKMGSDLTLESKRDLINKNLLELETDFEISKQKIKSEAIKASLQGFISHIEVRIDSTKLDLVQSYFYNHPYYGNIGIKCFFKTDSLSIGSHVLYYERKEYLRDEERISKIAISLPFFKK